MIDKYKNFPRSITFSFMMLITFAVGLFLLRAFSAISLYEPLQLMTSGDELSSHLAIWRYVNDLSIYTDRFQTPYYFAGYNWLYYHFYGFVVQTTLNVVGTHDAWIPTIARLITVMGCILGSWTAYHLLRISECNRTICFSLAVFLFYGPLVGFWGLTVRPDIWVITLELMGIYVFLKYFDKNIVLSVISAAIIFYLVWSFKQSGVIGLCSVGTFLLIKKRIDLAILYATIISLFWFLTFYFGGENYYNSIFFTGVEMVFTLERGIRNAFNFTAKFLPIIIIFIIFVFSIVRTGSYSKLYRDNNALFAITGVLISLCLAIPASMQTGASENYFFSTSVFLTLSAVHISKVINLNSSALSRYAVNGSIAIVCLLIILVPLKGLGVINVRQQHLAFLEGQVCIRDLPAPSFVNNRQLSFPWVSPGSEGYVLSHFYYIERAANMDFAEGGIGGRINDNFFSSLAIAGLEPNATHYDGGSLAGYERQADTCAGYNIYLRKYPD